MKNPLWHYHAAFDADALIRRHEVSSRVSNPGMITNFLDVKVDPKIHPSLLDNLAGAVEGVPIPQNWHADMAEWAAALRAVELSQDQFTMIELGCGWGCWMNATGTAARNLGRSVRVIGVEGDPGHIGYAVEALNRNGFSDNEWALHHGIAAPQGGTALFPTQDGGQWGLEPLFDCDKKQRSDAVATGRYQELPMVSLRDLVAAGRRIDLLHIDIQGGEADLIAASIDILEKSVAYLVIGTHSRQIEGRLFDTLLNAGWVLEMERPAILVLDGHPSPVVHVDGVQGWKNPRLFEPAVS